MKDLIERQAAIEALNEYFARIGKLKRRGLTKGEKAISLDTVGVIKELPSVSTEKLDKAKSEIRYGESKAYNADFTAGCEYAIGVIEKMLEGAEE